VNSSRKAGGGGENNSRNQKGKGRGPAGNTPPLIWRIEKKKKGYPRKKP